ncbi:MAG: cell wall-binding repeat-containing protein, partial [Actinomycetota bacterium]|nr:cell wall-binding repeat-containing protein [Actinomycetota bacterium]
GIQQVIVVGGPMAVSTAVLAALRADGVSVLRVAGPTAGATAAALAGLETASAGSHQGFGWDHHSAGFGVARGNGYQDGLAGAALLGRGFRGSGPVPLLLTASPTTLGQGLVSFLHRVGTRGVGSPPTPVSFLLVLGGPDAVSPALVQAMAGAL